MSKWEYKLLKTIDSVGLVWIFATYSLFLQEHGLTFLQMNSVNMFYMFTNTIVDPITGYWGDKYGHKKIFSIGVICMVIGAMIYFLSEGYFGFVIAEIVAAMGTALRSNALETYLVNQLPDGEGDRIISENRLLEKLVGIPVATTGSYVAHQFGLEYPWLLSAISCYILQCLLSLTNGKKVKVSDEMPIQKKSIPEKPNFLVALQDGFQTKQMRFIMLYAFIIAFCFQPFNMFWAIIAENNLGGLEYFPLLTIVMQLLMGIGGWSFKFMVKIPNGGLKIALLAVITLTAILLTVAGFSSGVIPVALFIVHELFRGAIGELARAYTNQLTKNVHRATVNSVRTSLSTLGSGCGLYISGLFADQLGAQNVWKIFGGILLLYGVIMITLEVFSRLWQSFRRRYG